MIRSGYSFRVAAGKIEEVISRLKEIHWSEAPICDRFSTFAFNRWSQLAKKESLRPVLGVEIGVTPELGCPRPIVDHWRFFAKTQMRSLHDMMWRASTHPGREPLLMYDQALHASDVIKISGSRLLLDRVAQRDLFCDFYKDFYVAMSPSTPTGLYRRARRMGLKFAAVSDNVFPRESDSDMYHVVLGKRSQGQSYSQWILSDEELRRSCRYASDEDFADAVDNRRFILASSRAEIKSATMIVPPKEKTLRQMCEEGAARLGVDLSDTVYAARLDRELRLIDEKKFADYFYVVADLLQWARQHMVCGPGRGSSSGSLVCFLLEITTVDPIKFNLVFERFIDITRADYPDIDLDISDEKRDLAFKYLERRYGSDRVARLGTVAFFQSKSCLNQVGAAVRAPRWMIDNAVNSVIIRSKGDSRADYKIEDTFKMTDAGKKLVAEYPAMAIAGRIEAHPYIRGRHAAGVVLTEQPVREYVAVDARSTTAMCDWQDAKDLDLLKIDVLGLTQLSIFERCLNLAGIKNAEAYLKALPLDDAEALGVLNKKYLAGVFQFQGATTKQVVHELNEVTEFEDIVSITSLCRPGPLGSGGTISWINRKNGVEEIKTHHPAFDPYLSQTLGVMIYQEQVMRICREIGDMSWADVTTLRKSMSKSLGIEFFNAYKAKFIPGALEKGISEDAATRMWDDMCSFGMYGFNRAHAVAYAIITYWCCWLKAHYPVEFAAATLDAESDPDKQIAILRELAVEGVSYIPVDPEHSTERWAVKIQANGKKILVGPLTTVIGIGPASVIEILEARRKGEPLRESLRRRLVSKKTRIASLWPIRDAVRRLYPNLERQLKYTKPTPVKDAFGKGGGVVLVVGVVMRNHPLNENEPGRVARRGYAIKEGQPVMALNFRLRDDTDDIFGKVSRWNFPRLGPMLEKARAGKSIFIVKGMVPADFRMVWAEEILYLGEVDDAADGGEVSTDGDAVVEVVQAPSRGDGDHGEALEPVGPLEPDQAAA
jgi:DNA polymerase III alpha subunit